LDDHIIDLILGRNEIDYRIKNFSKLLQPQTSELMPPDLGGHSKEKIINLITDWQHEKQNPHIPDHPSRMRHGLVFYFCGPYGTGRKTMAKSVCQDLELSILVVDISIIAHSENFERICPVMLREALLHGAVLYIDHFESLVENDEKGNRALDIITREIMGFPDIVIILACEKVLRVAQFKGEIYPVSITFSTPSYIKRKGLWQSFLKDIKFSDDISIGDLAAKFRFTAGQIEDAILTARNIAYLENASGSSLSSNHLYQGCRLQSNEKLEALAQKVTGNYVWNDIVLPREKKQQLKEILYHVKHKDLVYSGWDFENKLALGKGLNILFAGESGTGKTMAAQIIANELKIDLYKINLSAVVSKYIGETERT
jgi:ATPase family associated with various cellular activities (AAA)